MGRALDGIRVLDYSVWQQGPVAAMLLGDMGADAIKIEGRVGGDPARGMMRIAGAIATKDVARRNVYLEMANRNKGGLTLKLSEPQGRGILYRLVEKSGVLIHKFRSETIPKLGLQYSILSERNPGLICAGCSGWGPKGPEEDQEVIWQVGEIRSMPQTLDGSVKGYNHG